MKWPTLASICFLLTLPAVAFGQASTIERQVKGKPDTNINAGIFATIRHNCTAGPLPAVRLITPPAHGKVTVAGAFARDQLETMSWPGASGIRRDLPVGPGFHWPGYIYA